MEQKLIKVWKFPKSSNPNEFWEVKENEKCGLSCNCPIWVFNRNNRTCKHTEYVKEVNPIPSFDKAITKPPIILARVLKPIYDKEKHQLLIPLIAIPDAYLMSATICYYMLKYGYSMTEFNESYHTNWNKKDVLAHIKNNGECEYHKDFYRGCGH